MNQDELDRLRALQQEIIGEYGVWGSTDLARSSEQAAAEPLLTGRPDKLADLAHELGMAARELLDAKDELADIAQLHLDGAWAGSAHTAATKATRALHDDVLNAGATFNGIGYALLSYAGTLTDAQYGDRQGQWELSAAATRAAELTWGSIPKIAGLGYDGDAMRAAHHTAMEGAGNRVSAHAKAVENASTLIETLHDLATKARTANIKSGLSNLDNLLIAGAGGDESAILTPAMEKRATAAMDAMSAADRERWGQLLAGAQSPEQQAYLMKALAAGYPLDQIAGFDAMIAAHAGNADWLNEHLNPLDVDGTPKPGQQVITFDMASWNQGNYPTCVAASTIAARAQIDPLYALQLTTGGHPGDPAYDDPAAFVDRLRAEQSQVYHDQRNWLEEHFTKPGLSDSKSETIANQQLASHTGAGYHDVPMDDAQARATTVPSIERAVDDGYPVPLTTRESGDGHGMVVIGHSDGQLQIYNPWGYTFWVSEHDFITGDIDAVDTEIPKLPTSVRLPQEAN